MSQDRVRVALLVSLAVAAPGGTAMAFDRYGDRPPVILSPNLVEPWTAQLRPSYRDVTGPVVMAPQPVAPARAGRYATRPDGQPTVIRAAALDPAAGRDPDRQIEPRYLPQEVDYRGSEGPGSIVIDTNDRYLYLVLGNGKARRYGVGVGRPGFQWAGTHEVTRKAEWPDWTPPAAMLKRKPDLPRHMEGGPDNPLGSRALYLGSTEYRIHGTNEQIGRAHV